MKLDNNSKKKAVVIVVVPKPQVKGVQLELIKRKKPAVNFTWSNAN